MKKTVKRKKSGLLWPILASLAVLSISAAAFVGGRYYIDNKKPNFTKDCILYVYPHTTLHDISCILYEQAGMVRERSLWRAFEKTGLCGKDGSESRLKPGKYIVSPASTSIEVARKLVFGWQTSDNKLVLSGTIRTKERLAQKISAQMMVDSAAVMAALNDDAFLSRFGRTSENVFGLFLKDTYEIYWTSSIEDIFTRFHKEYRRFWNEDRKAKAAAQKLTPDEVEVLASIVTGESLVKQEFPLIAGVYLNRYHKGMRLQADPTIAFCYDYTLDRILKKHLKVDSPYNTYMHAGLPPAPINVPEKAALDAVLNPAQHNYLYFCASPDFDGTHDFAVTYSEHMRNARKFQHTLTLKRRAQADSLR